MATPENPLAVGVFRDRTLAKQTVEALRQAGFRDDEIRKWSGQGMEAANVSSSLVELGVPQEEADYYQHEAEVGRSVVAVRSYGHQQEANDILFRAGAYTAQTSLTHDLHTVPLREEVLTAQTQPVEVGEVFIRKEIVTEERTITVAVQREEIIIERCQLSTQDTPPEESMGTLVELAAGETIRIPNTA